MSVLDANINFSGLFVGYLLTKYSYRKVAFFGALLNSTGLILTSQANSLTHIILTYSIIGGIGTGLALASSFVALNSFFVKKRGQALGFSMAGTTMGMMLMPQIVQILLEIYGFRGTTLIIGGISLHSLIGACLLSPVPLKKVEEKLFESENSFSDEIGETSGENNPLLSGNDKKETTIKIPLEATNKSGALKLNENLTKNHYQRREESLTMRKSYLKKIKDFFGLHLLTNTKFLNVMIGVSLFYVAETNFKLFTPFFLFSIGMTKKEVAFCLSLTAFMDVLARLALPTLFDKLGFKKRTTFWICALCIAIGRSVFAEESNSTALIVTLVIVGFLRGSTIVNMNLTISEQCTLEMLPHAYGIFMVFKGTFVVFFSPAIGFLTKGLGTNFSAISSKLIDESTLEFRDKLIKLCKYNSGPEAIRIIEKAEKQLKAKVELNLEKTFTEILKMKYVFKKYFNELCDIDYAVHNYIIAIKPCLIEKTIYYPSTKYSNYIHRESQIATSFPENHQIIDLICDGMKNSLKEIIDVKCFEEKFSKLKRCFVKNNYFQNYVWILRNFNTTNVRPKNFPYHVITNAQPSFLTDLQEIIDFRRCLIDTLNTCKYSSLGYNIELNFFPDIEKINSLFN
ncbi:monocarboxylate transporter 1-like isoform X2 [Leptopilina heterotoma]|nr:monocarboxylate transporter 1-like isoform X2 [Leptopilina heterotoma]